MPSDITNIIADFNRYLAAREQAQMVEMARRYKQVEDNLSLYMKRLAEEITERRAMGQPVTPEAIMRPSRYIELMDQIAAEGKRYEAYAEGVIKAEQAEYIQAGIDAAGSAIRTMATSGINFNLLNKRAFADMLGMTADGSPLFDVLKKRALTPDMVAGLTDKLLEAVALGYNPTKTAAMMADGLAGGLTKALTIARTEQIRAYRTASQQQYTEAGVAKYQRHCALSERTCLACLALDGKIYEIETEIDSHPNCRCFMTPILPGMEIPQTQPGEQWLAKQSDEMKQSILGSHYELYQSGVPIDEMVRIKQDKTWGPTIGIKPLSAFED